MVHGCTRISFVIPTGVYSSEGNSSKNQHEGRTFALSLSADGNILYVFCTLEDEYYNGGGEYKAYREIIKSAVKGREIKFYEIPQPILQRHWMKQNVCYLVSLDLERQIINSMMT